MSLQLQRGTIERHLELPPNLVPIHWLQTHEWLISFAAKGLFHKRHFLQFTAKKLQTMVYSHLNEFMVKIWLKLQI